MNEIWSLLGLIAAFVASFAFALVLVIGLPLYGIRGALKFMYWKK